MKVKVILMCPERVRASVSEIKTQVCSKEVL